MSSDPSQTIEQTAEEQRELQKQVDRLEDSAPPEKSGGAMQAGARRYPEPPLPNRMVRHPGQQRRGFSRARDGE
jgi:hypothetical protein